VIGALYLDAGIDAVLEFMSPLLDETSDIILVMRRTEDPKSLLQEWAQSEGYSAPHYVTRSALGPDHSKIFEVDAMVNGRVQGTGQGHSKQAAAKAAARDALLKLGHITE
jgi:ribonuclease III